MNVPATIACLLLSAAPLAAGSLIQNGDFANGAKPWWGDGLKAGGVADGVLTLREGYVCQDKITVTGGRNYKISGKVKSDGAPENSVCAQLSFRGGGINGGWFGPVDVKLPWATEKALFATGGTHDWQPFSVVVRAPAGVNQMLLYLRKSPKTDGTAHFDDIRVEQTDEAAPRPAGAPPAGTLKNASFEDGKTGWWGQGKWRVENGAMRVESGFACQDKIPVEGGKRYRLAMKIKTENTPDDGAFVQISYRGPGVAEHWRGAHSIKLPRASERAAFVTGGSHDWREFSTVIAPPDTAETMLIYLRKKQDAAGVAFYDDVTLVETNDPETTAGQLKRETMAGKYLAPATAAAAAALADILTLKSSAAHKLAENGATQYRVHVAADADLMTLNSAKELAEYLGKITGADLLPLSHDAGPQKAPLLVVGRGNAVARALCKGVDFAALGEDGFIIKSHGPHIVIAGNTSGGTMYGVNWFLDHKLGVKWLSPDYEFVPSKKDVVLVRLDEMRVPRFTFRQILGVEGENKPFAARNLLNGNSHGAYGIIAPPEIDHFDPSWQRPGMTASFNQLLPSAQYGRFHGGGQLKMMDEGAREAAAKEIRARLDKEGADYGKYWFGFMDNDWGWDMDAASRAFAAKHGGHESAPRFDMAVDVLNRVRKTHPDFKMAANAYHWSFTPPENMKIPKELLVYPMTIQVDYSTPLNAGRNAGLGRDLENWNKTAENILLWDHVVNFHGYIQPTPNIYPIAESIRWLGGLENIHGYFAEASWNTRGSEFASLRTWLMARMLWDPQTEFRAAVAEYCDAYYGAAGKKVVEYIDFMHEVSRTTRSYLWEKTNVDAPMLTLDFTTKADAMLADAARLVANDAERLRHVEQVRVTIDYVVLLRRFEFAGEAKARGIAWDANFDARLARAKRVVEREKIRQYRQGGTMDEFFEIVALQRKPYAAPDFVENLPRTHWKEIQDLGFNRYYKTTVLVQDEKASDGVAARLNGSSGAWVIQAKRHLIPEEGEWEVYVELRAETEEPLDDNAVVARVGAAPPMSNTTPVYYKDVKDGGYTRVKIPGGPFRYSGAEGDSTYVCGSGNKKAGHVYVDRFIMVRTGEK